ncbi:hypothetical protein [Paraburkholderia fungorum]|uniref:hypothetical protein n=1 Tax=Paraburkholderia fungorum TaxID=134537 RepID=UPI00248D4DD4|nr:hypothetical protein [Paraburkholderia fungorum]
MQEDIGRKGEFAAQFQVRQGQPMHQRARIEVMKERGKMRSTEVGADFPGWLAIADHRKRNVIEKYCRPILKNTALRPLFIVRMP